ncbi:hypothetical protein AB1L42_10870 [Thalassoglobus sp. JC818]|uniref:hypothetical protein n=1 Tax=Thalassoglobus sp. JC818 TaxID=3232136 RepID=UPI00345817F6
MKAFAQVFACLFCIALAGVSVAQDAASSTLTDAEQAFVDQMTESVLVGQFSVDGRSDRAPKPERYSIQSVTKTSDDNWIVQARITYGKYDLPVPVPVQVIWAGDTPVLQVTDLKIPLMGEGFTARVMFYKDRYAGSWYHGKVGGHMWGSIERQSPDEGSKTPESESSESDE